MQVYHLSHTDLDGYGCQFIAKEFFSNITFYNANYGREVLVRVNAILDSISHSTQSLHSLLEQKFGKSKKSPTPTSHNKYLVLITDLNLTLSKANYLQQRIEELKINGVDVELLLLDHHISGQECADKYEWYHLQFYALCE